MSTIKTDLKYTTTHEWLRDNGDGTWTMGITDHAQDLLGDIVFVALPEIRTTINQGEELCTIESVKAASGVYAPADLEVISVNTALEEAPEMVNSDCYGEGFLAIFKADDLPSLLDAPAYQALLDSE